MILSRSLSARVGQFGVLGLQRPEDFVLLAKNAILESDKLVQEIVQGEASGQLVKNMDHISDIVCSVCDPANMCISVHPNPRFRQKAMEASTMLNDYLGVNYHTPLDNRVTHIHHPIMVTLL